ncbi:DUF4192 domain-containing protein [Actinomadura sp. NEAU-AAG7]|uniref:DUF4192 domain-containing protein n=1 Tax=Actinomadura sp. NEAU-AAG7 TaxID=2839640 RepID=UPI001BE3E14A|nr:DUF4192 domain-containing protein [Actinomadura sp. NEAU-AAG7]MBT2210956.1 DUF4192 family protein [Actinomadura sp. NEAU-AAG7]
MKPMVIRSAQDAIVAVPYLLGFHPSASLVVVAFDGPDGTCAVRVDLPSPDPANVSGMLAANGFRRVLLLAYGTPEESTSATAAMHAALVAAGIEVTEAVRVADGRWWSFTCDGDCCPPEGTPYDIGSSVLAAEATLAGHVALPGRADLADTLRPLTGPARQAMREATVRAERRYLGWARDDTSSFEFQAHLVREGVAVLPALLARARAGTRPSNDEAARLGFLLTELRVRDEGWVRIDEDDPAADIDFWRDIVRRVQPPYAAAPAALLAFAAYAAGNGGLANVALDRALEADPTYSMAVILREVMAAGIPPTRARMRMTPQELAAAYHEDETRQAS